MSTVRVNNIRSSDDTTEFGITERKWQVIKTARSSNPKPGQWSPSNSYNWAPGCYADYAPARSDTRIRFEIAISFGWEDGHAINHMIFYTNTNSEVSRHNHSGFHWEDRPLYVWDVASWGTNTRRIGYQMRCYGNGNRMRVNTTHYWNGSGSYQTAHTDWRIIEYLNP